MYDYIFAGTGVAAILLLDEILRSPLRESKILLIDRQLKKTNDRTICFWEKNAESDHFPIYRQWKQIEFVSEQFSKADNLGKYVYKCIRGIDLYDYLFNLIENHPNLEFVNDAVLEIEDCKESGKVLTTKSVYSGKVIFDSRYKVNDIPDSRSIYLKQFFRGWFISTSEPQFTPFKMRMFDLRVNQDHDFRFMYMLPFSETEALIELVTLSSINFDKEIKDFIHAQLGITDFQITGYEGGANPLTDSNPTRLTGKRIIRIGTAGGLIKPSSGFGYSRMRLDAKTIVQSLLRNDSPIKYRKFSRFYEFCDNLLLEVWSKQPQKGKAIFTGMFSHNSTENILMFLDETANPYQVIRLMLSMYPLIFIWYGARRIARGVWR